MALVSVFLDQTTLVFFLLMPCLQYNKKHQERRIWDVFCKVLNLTTLNPPNRLLVLSMNIFCAKPPHDALNSRWLQQSFFVKKQTANFFFFPAFKLTPSARYLILGDRSTLTKISCLEKNVLIVVRWQIEPVVSFFFLPSTCKYQRLLTVWSCEFQVFPLSLTLKVNLRSWNAKLSKPDSARLTGIFVIMTCGHAASDALMDCGTEGRGGGLGEPFSPTATLHHPFHTVIPP